MLIFLYFFEKNRNKLIFIRIVKENSRIFSSFSIETRKVRLLASLTTTDKALSLHCTLVNTRPNKWTFRFSKSKSSRQVTLTRGKSRLQARFLGMKPKICCRPLLHQIKSYLINRTLVNTRSNKWTFRRSISTRSHIGF